MESVNGSDGVCALLKGKRAKDIDDARNELLASGLIQREKQGRG
jgi:hypothetical protein